MRLSRAIIRRLSDQRGFTLVELMVSMAIGMVVVLAGHRLLATASGAAADVTHRAEAADRARNGMELITSRLRSQVCLNDDGPAIMRASPTVMDFFTVLGSTVPPPTIYGNTDPALDTAQARRLEFKPAANGRAGSIVEYQWNSPLPADDGNQLTRVPGAASVFPAAPTPSSTPSTRTLVTGIEPSKTSGGADLPIFKYFKFRGANPATPDLEVPPDVYTENSGDDLARIVRVEVQFDAVAETGSDGSGAKVTDGGKSGTDSTFQNEVFVRTADAGQPETSPECF